MKKSMLMLVALFVLGACSVAPNADWKKLVGGKTILDDEEVEVGTFSSDASEFTSSGLTMKLKESTANSATYKDGYSFVFTDVDEDGGTFNNDLVGKPDNIGTDRPFTFKQ